MLLPVPNLKRRTCRSTSFRSESYGDKWEYVRSNPVRHGYIADADDWPYQGELNVLRW